MVVFILGGIMFKKILRGKKSDKIGNYCNKLIELAKILDESWEYRKQFEEIFQKLKDLGYNPNREPLRKGENKPTEIETTINEYYEIENDLFKVVSRGDENFSKEFQMYQELTQELFLKSKEHAYAQLILSEHQPAYYNWPLFSLGEILVLSALIMLVRRGILFSHR